MNNRILNIISCFALLFMVQTVAAQCPNNNSQFGTSNAPSTVGVLTTLSSCMYGGEYRLVNNMVAGSQYSVETCGDTDFDTQLTIYDNSTGAVIAYNDDFCGLQSKVTFTSNGNSVRLLVDRYNCSNQSSCMTLRMTRVSGGAPAVNPCNSISPLSCTNNTGSFNLSGTGAWNGLGGPWSTPGEEQVFSFTPVLSGAHDIAITNSSYYVDLYVKAGSCGPTGWTYIDDISSFGTATNSVTLTAGVTYYFLIDDENTSANSGTISVTCPTPVNDPCNSITPIASCGSSASFSLSGGGAWNGLGGPWSTPGEEAVYSFTPTISGAYPIVVTNSGYYVDLYVKAGSCGSTGWTYVSDIFTNETNTVNLTAGVTYLFLIDDENTSASSGTITIDCPCIAPPGGVDDSYTYNGNFTISGTTVGACNDCSLRSSNDRVYAVNVTCAGSYTFSMCGGASWDTYLYLRTAACGGSSIALNDDACGLQSSITATLQPGTYYIHVEGFSASSQGAFNLAVSRACNLSANASSPIVGNCGTNVSCNGGNDGTASVSVNGGCGSTYAWSNGATSASISGLGAGTYTVVVTDQFGCTANASVDLTEPSALNVSAGNDQTVYYGYTPQSCADLNGSASGGCSGYSYSWTDGGFGTFTGEDINVCPSVSTDYTLTVTDQNGCSATDEVNVCVVDVTCFAGNSQNQKVEVCHTPPGNSGNSQTICINESAVAAHLAHGCSLGACDEQGLCSTASSRMSGSELHDEHSIELLVSPNPFIDRIAVEMFIEEDGFYEIELVNTYGQIIRSVYSGSLISAEQNKFEISTQELGKGIYFLRARDNGGQVALSKVLKM